MDFLKEMSAAEIATFMIAIGSHGIEHLLKPKWQLFKEALKKHLVNPIIGAIRNIVYPNVFDGIILVTAEEPSISERNYVNRRQRRYKRELREMKNQLRLQLRENSRLCDELQRKMQIEAKSEDFRRSFINVQVSMDFNFFKWILFSLVILAIARCVKSLI